MRCSDIKRAVIESKFVDENFVKNIIIRGNRITHKNWETSSCYIKNDVLYAIAGCTKEANKKGSVNQFINIVKLPANGTFIIDNMFFYRSDSIGRVSSILLVAENNLRERRTAAGKDNQERAKKKVV